MNIQNWFREKEATQVLKEAKESVALMWVPLPFHFYSKLLIVILIVIRELDAHEKSTLCIRPDIRCVWEL